uniref:Uncharacterized protein n=1 Tax=Candidatus Kentrum sp. SD TaxID=2126332 RepID=A0A451BP74_9GAMM|nr:MAG: hypothetical protein BECKSD772D_GA0070982_108211 [Candidatus Kentron sp. SD]
MTSKSKIFDFIIGHILPLIGVIIVLAVGYLVTDLVEKITVPELLAIAGFLVLAYVLILAVVSAIYIIPKSIRAKEKEEYDEFIKRVEGAFARKEEKYDEFLNNMDNSVKELMRRQKIIDQETLELIERDAKNIWVITTSLGSELNDKILMAAVKENLDRKKSYTYFIPHKANEGDFKNLAKNLPAFEREFDDYLDRIRFVRLPKDTQFLLEEVVIYNPGKKFHGAEQRHGLHGFILYDNHDDKQEKKIKGHMRVEREMLEYITDRLYAYLNQDKLFVVIRKILIDYWEDLNDDNRRHLVELMDRDEMDKKDYEEIIEQLKPMGLSNARIQEIDDLLKPHVPR